MSGPLIPDPTGPLTPSGNLRRRQTFSRIAEGAATGAAVIALAALVLVLWTVVSRGAPAISLDFLLEGYPDGVGPMLLGTIVIAMLATAIAMPIGVLVALYITEYSGAKGARALKLTLDLLNGLPSIILGLFAFVFIVEAQKKQSGFAGAVALAIIELPLIARGSQEVLQLVPKNLREASDALGVARWRTVLTVILPSALGGIITSTVLAVARAAGETAPLILATSAFDPKTFSVNPFEALPNVPTWIYKVSEEGNPEGYAEAWGMSLVLVFIILVTSLGARALLARSKRKLSSS
ncbi:MAG TPA: phosphate ABC transporter permease PstA [Solirubrobacterales bacterium]|nr:phosphate ABC transporter permease PstA [Solirubrobacterales bacterium]